MSQKAKSESPKIHPRASGSAVVKVLVVLGIGVALIAGAALVPSKNRETPAKEPAPVDVKVMPVAAQAEVPDTFDLPAVVEPNRTVTVAAEVAGRIERIPFKEGAVVHKGDVLLRINTDLIKPQFDGAQAQLTRDELELKRMTALVKDEATSRKDLDDATVRLAASKAKLEEEKARLERTTIYAPAAGVLNKLPMDEGEYVQPGTAVAEIVDAAAVKAVVDIPEPDIAFFKVGESVTVLADVKGCRQTLNGKITFISELAAQQTRSTRMEVTLANPEGLLHSGRIVHVLLQRRLLKDAIFVPLLAVIPMEASYVVYVAEDGAAQRRDIELGVIQGDRVQVTKGLKAGEQLILDGNRFVAPGQKIHIGS
jgi:membrane fusion protein, multidrug efflux system